MVEQQIPVTITKVTYGDARTRGLLRQWKVELARRYRIFDHACRNAELIMNALENEESTMNSSAFPRWEKTIEQVNELGPGRRFRIHALCKSTDDAKRLSTSLGVIADAAAAAGERLRSLGANRTMASREDR
jgi:hypothetical protein